MTIWTLRKPSLPARLLRHFRTNRMVYRLSIGLALFALIVGWLQMSWMAAFAVTFSVYVASGGWRFLRLLWLTLPRDVRVIVYLSKGLIGFRRMMKKNYTICDVFHETAEKHQEKVAFMFEEKCWTFREVECFSNKVANYFQSIGYKKGDVVALLMENRPELAFFWLGLGKIGVISSLINYNLKKESLAHSISIANSKALIYSADRSIVDAVAEISSSLGHINLYEFGNGCGSETQNPLKAEKILEKIKDSSENPPRQVDEKRYDDVLLYIYTSGTTGLPKASVIRHSRYYRLSFGWCVCVNMSSDDILYCVLPLYHTSACALAVGSVIFSGATLVVRRKFSASRFWEECIKYKATCALYIGELCRYLLAQPPRQSDKSHCIRFMSGNGLRPQVWKEFQTRFGVPSMVEFYGGTESNVGFINIDGRPGAVGFIPVVLAPILPIKIFKLDPFSGEIARGSDGFCIPCQPGEVGLLAGRIDKDDPKRPFDGYLNKQATAKKLGRDLLKKGDVWFLTGDTVWCDELGYVFFHDRLGDTFRWRGENVSTSEVEGVMANVLGLNSVVVFGVEIPGCEGRAGMAAIEDPDDAIDVKFLGKKLPEVLPSYARPIFLRVTNSINTTGTFKFQKMKLRKEGFDVSVVKDKIFYFDSSSGEYRELTKEICRKFLDGEMRI